MKSLKRFLTAVLFYKSNLWKEELPFQRADADLCPETRSLSYDARRSVFKIDRSRSGVVNDIVNYREFKVLTVNGKLKIRILLDRYSVEVFFNDGEKTASCVIYTPLEEDGISFYADGSARVDIEKNELLL